MLGIIIGFCKSKADLTIFVINYSFFNDLNHDSLDFTKYEF